MPSLVVIKIVLLNSLRTRTGVALLLFLGSVVLGPRLVGDVLMEEGNLDLVKASLGRSITTYQEVLFKPTVSPEDLRNLQNTSDIFLRAAQFDDNARVMANLLRTQIILGADSQVVVDRRTASSTCGNDTTCWFYLGWAAWRQENHELAVGAWKIAHAGFALLRLAKELESEEPPNVQMVEELYRLAVEVAPNDLRANEGLADFYIRRGHKQGAIVMLARIAELETDPVRHALALGRLYEQEGDWEKAAAAYEDACALDPTNAENYARLGAAYSRIDAQRAVLAWLRSIELNPRNFWAYLAVGDLYRGAGRYEEADIWYERAHAVSPDRPEPMTWTGMNAYLQGDWVSAESHFRVALKLDPSYAYAYWGLANSLYREGRPEEALAEYRQAAASESLNTDYQLSLADLLLELGRNDEASSVCRSILTWDTLNTAATQCLQEAGMHARDDIAGDR